MALKKLNPDQEDPPKHTGISSNEYISEANCLVDNSNEQYPGLDATLQCASDFDEGELPGL